MKLLIIVLLFFLVACTAAPVADTLNQAEEPDVVDLLEEEEAFLAQMEQDLEALESEP